MKAINAVSPSADSDEWRVQVNWVSFDEAEITWGLAPPHLQYKDAPGVPF